MNIFCVVITTAHPDYKNPMTETWVKFFLIKEDAEKYLKNEKRIYYNDRCILGLSEEGEEIQIGSDEDPSDYDETASKKIYSEHYMDNIPFDGYIYNVQEELDENSY